MFFSFEEQNGRCLFFSIEKVEVSFFFDTRREGGSRRTAFFCKEWEGTCAVFFEQWKGRYFFLSQKRREDVVLVERGRDVSLSQKKKKPKNGRSSCMF